jgi:hypothetical protein
MHAYMHGSCFAASSLALQHVPEAFVVDLGHVEHACFDGGLFLLVGQMDARRGLLVALLVDAPHVRIQHQDG